MTIKTLLAAAALALLPTLSLAAGCSSRGQEAMSCAAGSLWDSESKSCVPAVNT